MPALHAEGIRLVLSTTRFATSSATFILMAARAPRGNGMTKSDDLQSVLEDHARPNYEHQMAA